MNALCLYPHCEEKRWSGRNGKQKLAYCQEHQRQHWREQKESKRQRELLAEKEGKPRSSKLSLKRGRKAQGRKRTQVKPAPVQQTRSPVIASLADLPALEKVVLVDEKKGTITVVWQRKLEDLKQVDKCLELYETDGFEILINM